jgi:hypothetical protein
MHSELSWSMIDPRPVLKYVPKCNDYIVYWNGVVMPHSMALAQGMTLLNIHPTPEMKRVLHENYYKLYYSDAFGVGRQWESTVRYYQELCIWPLFSRYMEAHLNSLKQQNYSGSDILKWFDYNRIIS